MKIAIIGAGNMGGSIARGLAKGSLIDDSDIIVSNPSAGKLEKLKKEFPCISTTNNSFSLNFTKLFHNQISTITKSAFFKHSHRTI